MRLSKGQKDKLFMIIFKRALDMKQLIIKMQRGEKKTVICESATDDLSPSFGKYGGGCGGGSRA